MSRYAVLRFAAPFAAALSIACGLNEKSAPAAPTIADNTASLTAALAGSVPAAVSPINGQQIPSSKTTGPTLTATATPPSAGAAPNFTPQYRFRVLDSSSVVTQDSGLVSALTWTVPVLLTPSSRYTWIVRAEYQGLMGPWSPPASFTTPDALPAYSRPIGDWEPCGSLQSDVQLVACVVNAVRPDDTVSGFEVTKRVAWLRRKDGAGLLIKTSGENIITWQGRSFSASRICYPDGHIYKIFIDAGIGGLNAPTFADNGFVDKSLYVPAIDPSKP